MSGGDGEWRGTKESRAVCLKRGLFPVSSAVCCKKTVFQHATEVRAAVLCHLLHSAPRGGNRCAVRRKNSAKPHEACWM